MPGTVPGPHTEQWARGTAWTVLWFSAVCLLNAMVGRLNKASQDRYPFLHHLLLAHTKFLRNEIALDSRWPCVSGERRGIVFRHLCICFDGSIIILASGIRHDDAVFVCVARCCPRRASPTAVTTQSHKNLCVTQGFLIDSGSNFRTGGTASYQHPAVQTWLFFFRVCCWNRRELRSVNLMEGLGAPREWLMAS